MGKIIALQGDPKSGKTTTIGLLYNKLLDNNYVVIKKTRKNSRDFYTVLEKNGKKVGIMTYGDFKAIMLNRIEIFIRYRCEIIVCACHRNGITFNILHNVPGYTLEEPIQKRIGASKTQQKLMNEDDAERLFARIELLVQ